MKVNDSCGFHIHIGFPEIKRKDIDLMWILSYGIKILQIMVKSFIS